MTLEPARIERALEHLASLVEADPELALEFALSATEFFGALGLPAQDPLAARRQMEWFLLERPSAISDAPPVRELAQRARSGTRHDRIDEELLAALIGSLCGVFEVSSTEPGRGVWLRDLAGGGQLPLFEREASHLLVPGDLLCGRIFPLGDQSHCA